MRLRIAANLLLLLSVTVIAAACSSAESSPPRTAPGPGELTGIRIEVHESPGWGCCTQWVGYLQDNGAEVDVQEDPDLASFKAEVGVPAEAASCHTALVDGYVAEGHVPVGALVALLDQQPEAIGIALAGMPPDSPGMGGNEATWEAQPVVLINLDGSTEPFDY